MKKLKKLSLMLGLLLGFALMFNANNSNAFQEDPILEGHWVCCKSVSIGCVTFDGFPFPWDYPYFGGPFCP